MIEFGFTLHLFWWYIPAFYTAIVAAVAVFLVSNKYVGPLIILFWQFWACIMSIFIVWMVYLICALQLGIV